MPTFSFKLGREFLPEMPIEENQRCDVEYSVRKVNSFVSAFRIEKITFTVQQLNHIAPSSELYTKMIDAAKAHEKSLSETESQFWKAEAEMN